MADPADMILPLLREMRAENAQLHGRTHERVTLVEQRLDKLEATVNSYRHALTADSLLNKLVTGEFEEERIELLERKMRELERLK
jgi:hypothetical protein